ncbi:hypothetical protein MNBD_DELTA02-627 [hydrothermal vent metagenome]|uniref:DUF2007 domain-containing protein n=1 Tax=hydrothermal vent metagenome TaxID=652676 RepID=A0A3B0UWC9_9ZZZZ
MTKSPLFNILNSIMATRIRYIDLYSLSDDVDANIIENLLEDSDIPCLVNKFKMTSDGLDRTLPGDKDILVEEDQVEYARQVITDAIEQGLIKNGHFKA